MYYIVCVYISLSLYIYIYIYIYYVYTYKLHICIYIHITITRRPPRRGPALDGGAERGGGGRPLEEERGPGGDLSPIAPDGGLVALAGLWLPTPTCKAQPGNPPGII